jgi:hypothetical protein
MTSRFPLAWPPGKPRTLATRRKPGAFKSEGRMLTVDAAFGRIEYELDRIGGKYPLVSSNVELRLDGRPRMDRAPPADPGVCLYFELGGKPMAMACDAYASVPQNLGAIAAHLEATRAIARHGVATAAETLQAFVALPQPKSCWEILGLAPGSTAAQIREAWRAKAPAAHPDRGGSTAAMAELNAARDDALSKATA